MKILFLIRYLPKFTYHATAIRALLQRGHEVVLLEDRDKGEGLPHGAFDACSREFPNLKSVALLKRADVYRNALFGLRELISYGSYLSRSDQSRYYAQRWRSYLPIWARLFADSPAGLKGLKNPRFMRALRFLERKTPNDRAIVEKVKEINPDLVIASSINMRYSEELDYLKAAMQLGIPSMILVQSWDHLTTKGIYHAIPDMVVAWNNNHAGELMSIHGVPQDKIVISGSPFFDKWFLPPPVKVDREMFCRQFGLDPLRPYILYLGSSANIAEDESWLVRALSEKLKHSQNEALRKAGILVRPHPANWKPMANFKEEGVVVWPAPSEFKILDFESDEGTAWLKASLENALCTVGVNTSAMIDAVLLNKPCYAVVTGNYSLTQEQAKHFQNLVAYNVLDIVPDAAHCVLAFEKLLNGGDKKEAMRRKFIREFARPHGFTLSAGEIQAVAVEEVARGANKRQIEDAIALAIAAVDRTQEAQHTAFTPITPITLPLPVS